ncbi:hypothetical protein B0H13DRAFT_1855914 [Mycena leptocephala]|nr:hypothetical protein B0H13DRAFT_1855914 [Mycena leptocephala]
MPGRARRSERHGFSSVRVGTGNVKGFDGVVPLKLEILLETFPGYSLQKASQFLWRRYNACGRQQAGPTPNKQGTNRHLFGRDCQSPVRVTRMGGHQLKGHSVPLAYSTYLEKCSSGSWDSNEAYKTLERWDEKTRGMGKSEFNLVQDIRCLLHIPHILRSVQVDHGIPMKHIKPSRDGTRKLAGWDLRCLLNSV